MASIWGYKQRPAAPGPVTYASTYNNYNAESNSGPPQGMFNGAQSQGRVNPVPPVPQAGKWNRAPNQPNQPNQLNQQKFQQYNQPRLPNQSNFPKAAKVQKPFTCAGKHPTLALKELHPDAKFEVITQYLSIEGAAVVVAVTVNNVTYQGEGTNGKIARAIAAYKALVGIQANGHSTLARPADFKLQKKLVMERITKWQELQEKKEAEKAEGIQKRDENNTKMEIEDDTKSPHEKLVEEAIRRKAKQTKIASTNNDKRENIPDNAMVKQPAKKKVKDNTGEAKIPFEDFGTLVFKYGPDVIDVTILLEEKSPEGKPMFKCTLTVQGFEFEATGTKKKAARSAAVAQAHAQFSHSPPPHVNEKKIREEKNEDSSENNMTT